MSTPTHDHDHDHDHTPRYQGASLVSARVCTDCGAYISGLHLDVHDAFHDLLTPPPAPKPAKTKAKDKKK